jgi:type 1 glutamine amidotransferase
MADFERYVAEGGGLVSIHAADNHGAGWPEYNQMIGLGGWGGRKAGVSGYLLRLIDGEWTATSPDEGISGEHGPQREFLVIHDEPNHPILAGLPTEWMHATDELYSGLRGPAENVEVLAHAFSLHTNENEPVYMLIPYGEGMVFHVALGHYDNAAEPSGVAVKCVGYQTILARGTEYVATGKVTLGMPAAFPSAEAASVVAPEELVW